MSSTRYTLAELAERVGAEVDGDPSIVIEGVGSLAEATANQIGFLANPKYRKDLESTAAGAVILAPAARPACPSAALVHRNPYAIWARVVTLFAPKPWGPAGIHAAAVVDATASVADSAGIGPTAVILPGTTIGENCWIGPGCVVGPNASVGAGSRLVAQVHAGSDVHIGERCLIHAGAVIGADGFGHAPDFDAQGQGEWVKLPQLGGVRIGNDVEIGANTAIDCGALGDTVIEDGVKLDNLIQIAHNVHVGAHTVMAGQTAVAGSATIGRNCIIGGRAGFAGHITVADGCMIAGGAGITKDITERGVYSSAWPAEPDRIWRRRVARFRQLDRFIDRLKKVEKALSLENGND